MPSRGGGVMAAGKKELAAMRHCWEESASQGICSTSGGPVRCTPTDDERQEAETAGMADNVTYSVASSRPADEEPSVEGGRS
ncbi:hypothetical protein NDU88_001184 [Pleurodeles waltl]|uniref:Uncharacterized protein n=1 Tax=Pleurodeles waltl TaxID=8319 RepID=A0AAV7WL69_PLEWA|nr:hypothetical protein NDU88_001184 [Pleurodeles waltl]